MHYLNWPSYSTLNCGGCQANKPWKPVLLDTDGKAYA